MLDLMAPSYTPADTYHPPRPAPFDFGIETVSIAELMSDPTTVDILTSAAPWVLYLATVELFRPYVSIFTVSDAAKTFSIDTSSSEAALDAALRKLPPEQWPASVR